MTVKHDNQASLILLVLILLVKKIYKSYIYIPLRGDDPPDKLCFEYCSLILRLNIMEPERDTSSPLELLGTSIDI